jgi:hypothetical protein
LWSTPPTQGRGRALAHADSSRPVIAEARVRCQAIVLNVCGRSSDIWTHLSPSTSVLSCQNYSTLAPYPYFIYLTEIYRI